jgi:hypothetical protein
LRRLRRILISLGLAAAFLMAASAGFDIEGFGFKNL